MLDDSINEENINAIILQIESIKKTYNDDDKIEFIIKNINLNYIIIIDEEERIDIDFTNT